MSSKELLWRRMVRQQASSGMSVRAWCRQQNINESGFYWWRRELARRDAERPPTSRHNVGQTPSARRGAKGTPRKRSFAKSDRPTVEASKASFIPVQIAIDSSAHNDAGHIEIMLADGRCIRIHGSVDRQVLTDVLDVLASASAAQLERRAC